MKHGFNGRLIIISYLTIMKKQSNFTFFKRIAALTLAVFSLVAFMSPVSTAEAQNFNGSCYTFTADMQIGSSGPSVEALHTILAREGFNRTGSWSVSNQYYNEDTASLVSAFQQKYASEILTPAGLRYGTGYVGQYTRTKLNNLYSCSGGTGGTGTNSRAPVISNLSAPTTLRTNETGTWSLTATDPQNSQITYYVSWGDEYMLPYPVSGATVPSRDLYSQRATFTHAYANTGTYTVTFRARNSLGYESQTTATVYVTNNGGGTDTSGITVTTTPTKYNYAQGEAITFSIVARNTTAYEKVLNFSSGCQTSYRIGMYDSATNQICNQSLTNVRIPAYGTQTWTVAHYPNTYNLTSGTYSLTGRVIGYGESSVTITVDNGNGNGGGNCWNGSYYYNCGGNGGGTGTNIPRVINPNGGEWLQKGTYSTLQWQAANVVYFAAQGLDVNMILVSSGQYPYGPTTYPPYPYQTGNTTCPIGSTCAATPGQTYQSSSQSVNYPYCQGAQQYPYCGGYNGGYNNQTKFSILQNTTLTSYNWYVGSTPAGWSVLPSGTYLMQVCIAGSTTNCDVSDNTFTIN
jgi:hypothetical protein